MYTFVEKTNFVYDVCKTDHTYLNGFIESNPTYKIISSAPSNKGIIIGMRDMLLYYDSINITKRKFIEKYLSNYPEYII